MTKAWSPSRCILAGVAALALLSAGACTTPDREPAPPVSAAVVAPSVTVVTGPVLTADGTCTQAAAGSAVAIEPGIGECDLIRLKGKPATDVLIGEGRSGREVQVLYAEPGAKELYFFVNGRLDRIVKS